MKIKNFIKKKLGKNYYKFRLKYILNKVFGRFYVLTRKYLKKI